MRRVCRALLRDQGTAPDSAQAAIETAMAVILDVWHRSVLFRCAVAGPLSEVCAYTQSDGCSYVFVDLANLTCT